MGCSHLYKRSAEGNALCQVCGGSSTTIGTPVQEECRGQRPLPGMWGKLNDNWHACTRGVQRATPFARYVGEAQRQLARLYKRSAEGNALCQVCGGSSTTIGTPVQEECRGQRPLPGFGVSPKLPSHSFGVALATRVINYQ